MSITIPKFPAQAQRQPAHDDPLAPPPSRIVAPQRLGQLSLAALTVGAIVLGGIGWKVLTDVQAVPAYVLPAPGAVFAKWLTLVNTGVLWRNMGVTLSEAVLGFALAFVVGVTLGYFLARSRVLAGILAPYVAASQAVPVVALAPLLVLWFGFGLLPKVLICALIVFFPILINTAVGLRTIDRALLEAAHSFGAGRRQTLWHVEVPLALRTLLGGVKMGLTLALTGAVVGEFVASDVGLGNLMLRARFNYDAPLLYAALLTLVGLAVLAYAAVSALEHLLIDWD